MFTAREMEKECLDLKRLRDELRVQLKGDGAGLGKRQGGILKCSEEAAITSDEADSSADEVEPEDEKNCCNIKHLGVKSHLLHAPKNNLWLKKNQWALNVF